jgi:hypothetical protein
VGLFRAAGTAKNHGFPGLFGVWQMSQRESAKRGMIPSQAQDGLERDFKEIAMTRSKSHHDQFSADRSFPYVLVCSMLGSIVSLASVWLVTVHSVAQAMIA